MIFTTKLLFSNFEKQTSPSQILKKETPFVSTPLPFFLATIKATDAWRLVWMKRNIFSAFVFGGVFLWNFKKQNSFYRIRWHSPLPWQHTENTVQSGANHLIRQVSLPCEYYLSVKFCLKRSFIDYNIIKNSPSDPSIRLLLKVKKTPFEHQQNSHPTYI